MTMQRLQSRQRGGYRQLPGNENDESTYEGSYATNDWKQDVSRKTVFESTDRVDEAFQVNGSRTPIGRDELYYLQEGDHIGWHRPYLIWHHAIVVETDANNGRLRVIHFTKDNGRAVVKEEWIAAYKMLSGELFRFDYTEDVCMENPPELVLERARSIKGLRGYRFFKNNCEHVALFCKTGKTDCAQVHWFGGKVKETLHTGLANVAKCGTKLGCAISKEAAKQTLTSVGETAVKVGASETVETIGKASNWVGAGLLVGIETIHCGYDIYQFNKKRKEGKMTNRDFKITTTERVSGAVVGSGFAIGGSILGELAGGAIGGFLGSCIPVIGTAIGAAVGAFAGSIIGGLVGSFVGKIAGTMVGGWLGRLFW